MNVKELKQLDIGVKGINLLDVTCTRMWDWKKSSKENLPGTHGIMVSDASDKVLINVNCDEPLSTAIKDKKINVLGISVKKGTKEYPEGSGKYPNSFYAREIELVGEPVTAPASQHSDPAPSPAPRPSPAQAASQAPEIITADRAIDFIAHAHALYLRRLFEEMSTVGVPEAIVTIIAGNPDSLSAMANSALIQMDRSGALYKTGNGKKDDGFVDFLKAVREVQGKSGMPDNEVKDACGLFGFESVKQIPDAQRGKFLAHLDAHGAAWKAKQQPAEKAAVADPDLPF